MRDRSHRAHTLQTTLSAPQKAIVLSLYQSPYLPLHDLLYTTRHYINADVSHAGLARLLKREGMSQLEDVIPKAEGETISPKKTFWDYQPGFVHIDIKYLRLMPDEASLRYHFVAVYCATRWVFMHIYGDMTNEISVGLAAYEGGFANRDYYGLQSTDRFFTKDKKPSGDQASTITSATSTNEQHSAAVQWPYQRAIAATRFDSTADPEKTLLSYLKLYNHHIPQRAICTKTPIWALKEW